MKLTTFSKSEILKRNYCKNLSLYLLLTDKVSINSKNMKIAEGFLESIFFS